MRLLVIEDDDHVAEPLVDGLRLHGHAVRRTALGLEGVQLAAVVDLVLLDLGLPDLDGFEVCRRIRRASAVPIIVVTARADELDRVLGLQVGADDYIVKPFSFRELVARVEAVSRRSMQQSRPVVDVTDASATARGGPESLCDCQSSSTSEVEVRRSDRARSTERSAAPVRAHSTLALDNRTRQVTVEGTPVALTRKEFDLLEFLLRDPGAVIPRETIIANVWDPNWYGSTRTLDVHVASLRSKLGDARWIETVRGIGYRLPDSEQLQFTTTSET